MTDQVSPEGAVAPDANASPVAQPAAEATPPVANGSEAESSPAAPDAGEQQPKEAKGPGKRIDELTRNWRSEQRAHEETRALNRKLMDLLEKGMSQQQAIPQQGEKTLADFGGDERAYRAHVVNEAREEAKRAAREETDRFVDDQNREARKADFHEKAEKFAAEIEDYEEVTQDPNLRITPDMADAIMESDDGPAIFYYLGNNPKIADRLAAMTPARAGVEIAKIGQKLAAERAKAALQPVSKAPPPPATLKASEPGVRAKPSEPDSDKLSDADWFKARQREIRERNK